MLPPERRLGRVLELIDDGKYFTLHAGRQTGKTTCAFTAAHVDAAKRTILRERRTQPRCRQAAAAFRTSGAATDTSPPKALATARPVRTSCGWRFSSGWGAAGGASRPGR